MKFIDAYSRTSQKEYVVQKCTEYNSKIYAYRNKISDFDPRITAFETRKSYV